MAKSSKMTKTTKKYIISITILVLVTALTIYFVLKQDPKAVIDAIRTCDVKWLLIALVIMIVSYLIEGLILTIFARMYKRNYPYYKGILNTFIGVFFSDITPSNSGGQFVQTYTFSKQGVKITNAASILFMHFIIYQLVIVGFSAVVFGCKFEEMRALTALIPIGNLNFDMISLSLIGFIVNAFVIIGLFFLAFSKRLHAFIIKYGIGLLSKLHIVKNKDDSILKLNTKVETFRVEFFRLLQNWPVLIITSILFFIRIVLLNSIPYFIAKAMGLTFASSDEVMNIINTTSMTLLVSSITQMVPIPGASGGAELVFQYMFGGTFFVGASGTDISALILIWRGLTFYLGLFIGFIVFVSYHESPKKESFLHGDSRTLLELDVINLDNAEKEKKAKESSIVHVEPQLLTVDDIEAHFAALKADLQPQLEKNTESLIKEEDKKEKKKKWRKK